MRNNTILETPSQALEFLSTAAPAALAMEPHRSTSDTYKFLPTRPIVEAAYDHGLRLVDANQRMSRRATSFDDQSGVHLLRFRSLDAPRVGDVFSEIVLRNGHAANTTLNTMGGLFRMACSNGLIIPATGEVVEGLSIRHVQGADHDLDAIIAHMIQSGEMATERLEKTEDWNRLDIRANRDVQAVATKALVSAGVKARWGSWDEVPQSDLRCARDFAIPIRSADDTGSLWSAVNTVQETLIRGTRTNRSATRNRVRKIRECKDLDTQTRINAAVWRAGEKVAEYLQG